MEQSQENLSTRERLIEVAGELFAEKGFKETTIREICEKAEANVAAVNYHFRDKDNLYHEVILHIVNHVKGRFSMDQTVDPAAPAPERLYQFVHTLLMRRFDPERPQWQNILIYKEILEPRSDGMAGVHAERVRDQQVLEAIIHDLVGEIDPQRLILVSMSIVGQCLFYVMVHAPHSPIPQEELIPMDREAIAIIARHITDFSLSGLNRPNVQDHESPVI